MPSMALAMELCHAVKEESQCCYFCSHRAHYCAGWKWTSVKRLWLGFTWKPWGFLLNQSWGRWVHMRCWQIPIKDKKYQLTFFMGGGTSLTESSGSSQEMVQMTTEQVTRKADEMLLWGHLPEKEWCLVPLWLQNRSAFREGGSTAQPGSCNT